MGQLGLLERDFRLVGRDSIGKTTKEISIDEYVI